jgi:hypothetical protein
MPSLRRGGPHVIPSLFLLRDVTHRPRRLGQLAGDDRPELDHGDVAADLLDLGVRGSMPSEATVERRPESGTVSLSSTLSAWLLRASISSS